MAKKMIQIGAGNIGRACIGRLFHQANYKIYFSDINAELISMIHEIKEYNVRMVGKDFDEKLNDLVFASDLFRKVKEVEMKEAKP